MGWADSPGTPLLRSAGSTRAGKAEVGTSLRRCGKGKFSPHTSGGETPPTSWASQRTLLTWGALGAVGKPEAVTWLKDDSAVGTSKSLLGLVWRTRAGVGTLKLHQISEGAGCPRPKEGGLQCVCSATRKTKNIPGCPTLFPLRRPPITRGKEGSGCHHSGPGGPAPELRAHT